MVTNKRLPSRIRQGLNVESGLNDGVCVPLLIIFLTIAQAEEGIGHIEPLKVVVRMLPVALSMLGTGMRRVTVGFLGWFGPRGLASIVFVLILVEQTQLPERPLMLAVVTWTVALSVYAHGLSAWPSANRYADWYADHTSDHDTRTPRSRRSQPSDIMAKSYMSLNRAYCRDVESTEARKGMTVPPYSLRPPGRDQRWTSTDIPQPTPLP